MAVPRLGIRRGAAAVAAAALVGMAGHAAVLTPVASAHDVVVGGSVEEGKVYDSFPRTITLEFSAIPRDGFNTFAVQDKDTGETLFDAEPTINDRELTIDTPADVHPGDGDYQVGYQITSSDGHATRGGVSFEVAGSAEESGTASTTGERASEEGAPADHNGDSAAEAQSDSSSAVLPWILGVGAVLVVAAVAVMLIAKLRSSRETTQTSGKYPDERGGSGAGHGSRR